MIANIYPTDSHLKIIKEIGCTVLVGMATVNAGLAIATFEEKITCNYTAFVFFAMAVMAPILLGTCILDMFLNYYDKTSIDPVEYEKSISEYNLKIRILIYCSILFPFIGILILIFFGENKNESFATSAFGLISIVWVGILFLRDIKFQIIKLVEKTGVKDACQKIYFLIEITTLLIILAILLRTLLILSLMICGKL